MEKVEFNEKDQGRVRGLSKAIYIIAKICRIFTYIGIVFMAVFMAFVPHIVNNVEIKDSVITVEGVGKFSMKDLNIDIKSKDEKIAKDAGEYAIGKIEDVLEKHSKTEIILFIEGGLLFAVASMVVGALILKKIEKLFKNISTLDSPFVLENVELIKKINCLLIAAIALSCLTSVYLDTMIGAKVKFNINLETVIGILVVFVVMYVFKYGCTLQEKSKKKIYE